MAQKTTDSRDASSHRRWLPLGLCGAFLALWVAAFAAGGCSTAQDRESPANLLGVLRFRDAQAVELFQRSHRAGNLYQDFRPVLTVDAIPLDLAYRERYLRMLQERYLLPESELANLKGENDREFENAFDLIVLVYGGSNEAVQLEKANPKWRVLLRDDDGHLLVASRLEKIRDDSATFQYLNVYFQGLDRWSQVYRIRFPKLEKSVIGKAPGKGPVQLVVTGVEGTVTLSWTDSGLFYRVAPGAALLR